MLIVRNTIPDLSWTSLGSYRDKTRPLGWRAGTATTERLGVRGKTNQSTRVQTERAACMATSTVSTTRGPEFNTDASSGEGTITMPVTKGTRKGKARIRWDRNVSQAGHSGAFPDTEKRSQNRGIQESQEQKGSILRKQRTNLRVNIILCKHEPKELRINLKRAESIHHPTCQRQRSQETAPRSEMSS